ncbi:hypothetical protein K438DRAFT_1497667, partial [Mycena galopus ATCC 62051]
LVWSTRCPTNTAQKLPNWEDLCEKSFFRIAYAVKEHDIPAGLIVNADQTQIIHAPGTGLTWAEKGAKQVSVVGMEEKRAFTTMVALSIDGTLLDSQLIYQGSTPRSRPDSHARGYHQLADVGCKFVSLCTDTYWSNFGTMKEFVTEILVPYFERVKACLRLPPNQKAIYQLDVWAGHRSKQFREGLAAMCPWIIPDFIPGG